MRRFITSIHGAAICLVCLMLASGVRAQVSVNPNCNGSLFNLEPRLNAIPQNTESIDFLPNRNPSGADLVVGAANDARSAIGGFDAYYVHRGSSPDCSVDFEGTISTGGINPAIIADPARDGFIFADVILSFSQTVELARTTAATLLSTTLCPSGTQLNGNNPNCWPVFGIADFTNPKIKQAALLNQSIAVDSRTSGTGAGDVYVAAQFENTVKFPAVANIQVIACSNASLKCGAPVVVSGTDTFGSYPHAEVRQDGTITISYWTYTKPFGTQPNPINIKFVTCTPKGAPNAPTCSTPTLVTSGNRTGYAPGDSGFEDFLFPKHANRLEADGKTFTTFLVYDRCQSIIGSPSLLAPACSKVDVMVTFSTDGGATWSTPQAVESGAGHQFFGTIRNDTSTETMNIAYYSTQDDMFLQRAKIRLRQIAPGSTMLDRANILTMDSTDPDAGIQDLIGGPVIVFGDRIGLASAGTGTAGQSKVYVHYTWNNLFGIYNGTQQPDQNNTVVGASY